jgi:outer membrane receptor protein involved in Fe transport
MKPTIAILTTIFLFLTFTISAQQHGGGRGGQGQSGPPIGTVTGTIEEFGTGNLMEYANVVLFSVRDSAMVTGAITTADGKFILEKVPFGRYYLVANFIGFNKETIQEVKITPQKSFFDVGLIKLHSSTETLEAVEITAQKELIEYQIDKKVVNVSQDIMAQGGSAVTALENTPSVQVDIDGNVSLRGSSSFTVLIDGRPSILQGTDALQQIPASNIETIEIITNPSAKYDPDGVAGIINVVLKEKIDKGLSGVVNASVGSSNSSSFDFLLNYRYKKFNFFAGADYNNRRHEGERESRDETYRNDTTFYRDNFGSRNRGRDGYGARGGVEYFITSRTMVSAEGRIGYYDFNGGGESYLYQYTSPATTDFYSTNISDMSRNGTYYNGKLSFQHKFDTKGHQIDMMLYYAHRDGDDSDEQKETDTDALYQPIEEEPYFIRTTEKDDDNEFRFNVDYVLPIGDEGKIETGYQTRIEDETEVYVFTNYDYPTNEWLEDTLFSNSMDFRRDIHAIYGIYSNKWKSFGYQLGLRGEYTYRQIKNAQSADGALIDRWDLFPSLHLSKSFANKNQMLASYTRRIDRPNGWFLDPFVNYIDQFNYRKGNPDLLPEYTDSYELGYQMWAWGAMFSLEGYYRATTNKITRIRTLQPDNTFMHTFENLNSDYSLGGELMVRFDPAKWLNLNLSANIYQYRLEGNVEDQSVDGESLNWNSRLNAIVKLPYQMRLQVNGMYNGPTITAQGEMDGFFMTNAAVRKDFFNQNLSATFSVRDIFNTGKHEFTSSGTGFYSYNYFNRKAPIFSLSLSWKINNYEKRSDRNGDNGGAPAEMDGDF